MRIRTFFLALIVSLGISPAALAFGTLVSSEEPASSETGSQQSVQNEPLDVESASVNVLINNGIAVTKVEQTFLNHQDRQREGTYRFPLPRNASIANFAMKINGKWINGEVLEKKRAREIYDSIVNKKQDPGLLEQVDYKEFSVRVFPIPANGKQKIRISYYQPLPKDSNYRVYTFPLERSFDSEPPSVGELSFDVEVLSEAPLEKVYSPSHSDMISIQKNEDRYFRATAEESRTRLDHDFVIAYRLKKKETRMGLLATRPEGKDGYFMTVVTPSTSLEAKAGGTDYTFLLDASGSMQDGKLDLAKKALEQFLKSLSEQDRFDIVRFRKSDRFFAGEHLPATGEHIAEAGNFVGSIDSRGGTNLKNALRRAIESYNGDQTHNIVIFSDGQAHDETYLEIAETGDTEVRIFTLGIGNEVSRPLLKSLADQTGGHADFMSSAGDLKRRVNVLKKKSANPVIKDLSLSVEGADIREVHPDPIPDVFAGQQLLLFGRYSGTGEAKVTLSGTVNGKSWNMDRTFSLPGPTSRHKHIERIWAMAYIRDLLRTVRSGNASTSAKDQIVDLGTEYSVVTPFTSFLVLRNEEAYNSRDIERTNKRRIKAERASQQKARQRAKQHRRANRKQQTPFRADDSSTSGRDYDGGGGMGGGPIGPFFLLLMSIPMIAGAVRNWFSR